MSVYVRRAAEAPLSPAGSAGAAAAAAAAASALASAALSAVSPACGREAAPADAGAPADGCGGLACGAWWKRKPPRGATPPPGPGAAGLTAVRGGLLDSKPQAPVSFPASAMPWLSAAAATEETVKSGKSHPTTVLPPAAASDFPSPPESPPPPVPPRRGAFGGATAPLPAPRSSAKIAASPNDATQTLSTSATSASSSPGEARGGAWPAGPRVAAGSLPGFARFLETCVAGARDGGPVDDFFVPEPLVRQTLCREAGLGEKELAAATAGCVCRLSSLPAVELDLARRRSSVAPPAAAAATLAASAARVQIPLIGVALHPLDASAEARLSAAELGAREAERWTALSAAVRGLRRLAVQHGFRVLFLPDLRGRGPAVRAAVAAVLRRRPDAVEAFRAREPLPIELARGDILGYVGARAALQRLAAIAGDPGFDRDFLRCFATFAGSHKMLGAVGYLWRTGDGGVGADPAVDWEDAFDPEDLADLLWRASAGVPARVTFFANAGGVYEVKIEAFRDEEGTDSVDVDSLEDEPPERLWIRRREPVAPFLAFHPPPQPLVPLSLGEVTRAETGKICAVTYEVDNVEAMGKALLLRQY